MKRLAILGSTGSIGKNTLKVVQHLEGQFDVVALAAHSNIDLIEQQALLFHPKIIAVFDPVRAVELQKRLPGVEVVAGIEGVITAATYDDVDFVVSAMAGTLGLCPTLAAIEAGKDVGLANKEALVSGGDLVMDAVKRKGVRLIPIDSEHSAIFQCLQGEEMCAVDRLILTASGGPFREMSLKELEQATVAQALRHPTWSMGAKVTIDSSTLMNKGLELIEARWLFDIPAERIDVVIHPQSIIHSMVAFKDRSLIAQLGEPSMITPIQYALTYPNRQQGLLHPFNMTAHPNLTFATPDQSRFRCLALAIDAIKEGGSVPGYMNAANEVLVNRCLQGEIGWIEIGQKLETLLDKHMKKKLDSLEDVLEIDRIGREEAAKL